VAKELSKMALEELWELFPIILKEHSTDYKDWYAKEEALLLEVLDSGVAMRLSHIGSTAVDGLLAKPTVDILLEVDGCSDINSFGRQLEGIGWMLMSEQKSPFELSYNKGYTPEGFADKVFHLHIRYFGDWDELYFRDCLIAHPNVAREYAKLKTKLAKEFMNDRDAYTGAKADFVQKYSSLGKKEQNHKYKPKGFGSL